jgi:hypothetical protein
VEAAVAVVAQALVLFRVQLVLTDKEITAVQD